MEIPQQGNFFNKILPFFTTVFGNIFSRIEWNGICPFMAVNYFLIKTLNQMKKLIPAIFLFSGACLFSACGNNDNSTDATADSTMTTMESTNPNSVSDDGEDFVKDAAKGGLMEVELGKLAQEKGSSQDVKNFGKMMVDDHSKANADLKQVAALKSIQIPDSLNEDQIKDMDDLSKKSGADFDKAYVDMMVDDHKEDVDDFKKAADDINDTDIKTFAQNTLPVLQKHLDRINEIKSKM